MKKQINFIAFLGPDGSGKSTIIEELKKRDLPFRRIDYFHLKPRLFGDKDINKIVTNPHAKKPYRGILSYLKLFHFMSDYIIGYFIKILPLKIKSSLIVFDRYYDDILIDPKRFRYGGSLKFAKIMRIFIPKPDIYFVLVAEADVLYKRKQEVEFNELQRQLNEYKKLTDHKKYILIDVNRDVERIVDEIENYLFNRLSVKGNFKQ
jgi:thymidylate kinase